MLGDLGFCLLICCWDRVSLWSPSYPGAHSVDQAGPELKEISLLPPPEELELKSCVTEPHVSFVGTRGQTPGTWCIEPKWVLASAAHILKLEHYRD